MAVFQHHLMVSQTTRAEINTTVPASRSTHYILAVPLALSPLWSLVVTAPTTSVRCISQIAPDSPSQAAVNQITGVCTDFTRQLPLALPKFYAGPNSQRSDSYLTIIPNITGHTKSYIKLLFILRSVSVRYLKFPGASTKAAFATASSA